jgi:Fur family ferric uptake transcriptional regulator
MPARDHGSEVASLALVLTAGSISGKILNENRFHLESAMTLTEKAIESILRRHGYKITRQRRAVLSAIALDRDHLTPADVYRRVRQEHPGIGLVTVYRTLEMLDSLGLICEVHSGGNCRSYLLRRPAEHHHHLVCADCGTVADFTGCDLGELERRVSRETGFEIEGHLLELSGRCHGCSTGAVQE